MTVTYQTTSILLWSDLSENNSVTQKNSVNLPENRKYFPVLSSLIRCYVQQGTTNTPRVLTLRNNTSQAESHEKLLPHQYITVILMSAQQEQATWSKTKIWFTRQTTSKQHPTVTKQVHCPKQVFIVITGKLWPCQRWTKWGWKRYGQREGRKEKFQKRNHGKAQQGNALEVSRQQKNLFKQELNSNFWRYWIVGLRIVSTEV